VTSILTHVKSLKLAERKPKANPLKIEFLTVVIVLRNSIIFLPDLGFEPGTFITNFSATDRTNDKLVSNSNNVMRAK